MTNIMINSHFLQSTRIVLLSAKRFKSGLANLFVLKRQFCSNPVHIRHTNERLQNFIVKPSCSLKKKKKIIAGKNSLIFTFPTYKLYILDISCGAFFI